MVVEIVTDCTENGFPMYWVAVDGARVGCLLDADGKEWSLFFTTRRFYPIRLQIELLSAVQDYLSCNSLPVYQRRTG
jgi:hypothetical protein